MTAALDVGPPPMRISIDDQFEGKQTGEDLVNQFQGIAGWSQFAVL